MTLFDHYKRLVYREARRLRRIEVRQHRSEGSRKGWVTKKALKGQHP